MKRFYSFILATLMIGTIILTINAAALASGTPVADHQEEATCTPACDYCDTPMNTSYTRWTPWFFNGATKASDTIPYIISYTHTRSRLVTFKCPQCSYSRICTDLEEKDALNENSFRWMTYDEALMYHPEVPVPVVFRGAFIQACQIRLHLPVDIRQGQQDAFLCKPENISCISALYSDGQTAYRIEFYPHAVNDNVRINRDDEYMMLAEYGTVKGVCLKQGNYFLDIYDGKANALPDVLIPGLTVDMLSYGTSSVNENNASAILRDDEAAGLLDALILFIDPV